MRPHDPTFDDAFARCFPRAFRAASRIVGEAAGEDAAAEALARAFAQWPKVRGLPHLDAWVMRVAINLALDQSRRQRRRLPQPADAARGESDVVALVALRSALARLPRRQREAVVLCHYAGFTTSEAAAALGVSLGTVDTHVRRGLAALRGHLRDERELATWTT